MLLALPCRDAGFLLEILPAAHAWNAVRAYTLLLGRRAIFSHVSSSSSSRYSLIGNSLPHDVQRMVAAFQPILRTTSFPHALHFM